MLDWKLDKLDEKIGEIKILLFQQHQKSSAGNLYKEVNLKILRFDNS